MRSRRRKPGALARLLASFSLSVVLVAALTAPAVKAQPVIEPTIDLPPELAAKRARATAAAQAVTIMMADWFGPLPSATLRIEGTRWQGSDSPASQPGVVSVPVRWLSPVRDQSMERALIAAVVQQYWQGGAATPFQDALREYIAIRAIHHILEGSNFAAPRFFGGHVSFPLRSLLLSPQVGDPRPRVWAFDDGVVDPELSRRLRAWQTLERYVGWPTLLQAISSMRAAGPSQWSEAALGEILSTQSGVDVREVVRQCFSVDVDYAMKNLQSGAVAGGMIETTVTVADGGPRWSIPLQVRFADGTTIRDAVAGGEAGMQPVTMTYTAKSPAVSATIDPDVTWLLDRNRENNAIVRDAPTSPLGVRLALHWLAWLQNAMLSYTAVV